MRSLLLRPGATTLSSATPIEDTPKARWGSLALWVVGCLLLGTAGGLVTASSVDSWYPGLAKPDWNPPNAVFAPVWTILFVMMGVAAWLVWQQRRRADVRKPLVLFGVQMALNSAWSMIFFGLRRPDIAALEIVVLWLAIAATIVAFYRVSKVATWLLAPYLAWVSFATALNLAIWQLNR